MFLRILKGHVAVTKAKKDSYFDETVRYYLKAVFLGNALVMEYGDKIVGIAKLHEETEKYKDYDVVVAQRCIPGHERVVRSIKDMIGKSNKFSFTPTNKRRKYYVELVDTDILPIKAELVFSKI